MFVTRSITTAFLPRRGCGRRSAGIRTFTVCARMGSEIPGGNRLESLAYRRRSIHISSIAGSFPTTRSHRSDQKREFVSTRQSMNCARRWTSINGALGILMAGAGRRLPGTGHRDGCRIALTRTASAWCGLSTISSTWKSSMPARPCSNKQQCGCPSCCNNRSRRTRRLRKSTAAFALS